MKHYCLPDIQIQLPDSTPWQRLSIGVRMMWYLFWYKSFKISETSIYISLPIGDNNDAQ